MLGCAWKRVWKITVHSRHFWNLQTKVVSFVHDNFFLGVNQKTKFSHGGAFFLHQGRHHKLATAWDWLESPVHACYGSMDWCKWHPALYHKGGFTRILSCPSFLKDCPSKIDQNGLKLNKWSKMVILVSTSNWACMTLTGPSYNV